MRSLVSFAALFSVAQAIIAPGLVRQTSQDSCGYVVGPLQVVPTLAVFPFTVGFICTFPACFQDFRMGSLTPGEDSCLCSSQIPTFMTTNPVARAGVQLVGAPATANALTAMLVRGFTRSSME